jgi:histidyl-tRNA synthetase
MLLLETLELVPEDAKGGADAYLLAMGESAEREALLLGERLRDALPELRLQVHCGGGSFKSQIRRADRSGARFALILGEDEIANARLTLKPLRDDSEQQTLAQDDAIAWLGRQFA